MAEKIGLFGGTFDPPHIEHRNSVERAAEEFRLDRVVILPCGTPPHKQHIPVTDAGHRFRMSELAFCEIPQVQISPFEMEQAGKSYSYLTAEHFAGLYPDAELYFLVGADSYRDILNGLWVHAERLTAAAKLLVTAREGVSADLSGALVSSYQGREISSTMTRIRLEFGLGTEEVAPAVLDYINANGLYQSYRRYADEVKARVKPSRYLHTAYVVEAALAINRQLKLGLSEEKLFVAATLHDIAKDMTADQAEGAGLNIRDALALPEPVRHSYFGAALAEKLFPQLSEDVLNAIRFHTTFRAEMSELEKVVALADGVERRRDYLGVEEIRKMSGIDLNHACLLYLEHTAAYLAEKNLPVAESTKKAIEYFKEKTK